MNAFVLISILLIANIWSSFGQVVPPSTFCEGLKSGVYCSNDFFGYYNCFLPPLNLTQYVGCTIGDICLGFLGFPCTNDTPCGTPIVPPSFPKAYESTYTANSTDCYPEFCANIVSEITEYFDLGKSRYRRDTVTNGTKTDIVLMFGDYNGPVVIYDIYPMNGDCIINALGNDTYYWQGIPSGFLPYNNNNSSSSTDDVDYWWFEEFVVGEGGEYSMWSVIETDNENIVNPIEFYNSYNSGNQYYGEERDTYISFSTTVPPDYLFNTPTNCRHTST